MIVLYVVLGVLACFIIAIIRGGGGRALASYFLYTLCSILMIPLMAICPKLHMRIMNWTIEINKDSVHHAGFIESVADEVGRSVAKHMKEEK